VPVPDELTPLVPGVGEAEAEDDVVEPELQSLEEVLAGLALGSGRVPVGVTEVASSSPYMRFTFCFSRS